MPALPGILLCIATGFVIACLGGPKQAPICSHLLLKSALSTGFGLGAFSLVFFLALSLSLSILLLFDVLVLAALLGVLLWRRFRHPAEARAEIPPEGEANSGGRIRPALACAFGVALIGALYASTARAVASPHGSGWDAFAIWNLRARFLFHNTAHWRDAFTALHPWSHPDYPLLLPAAIAHFWNLLGRVSPWVPAAIGLAFTFSTVALLFSGLSILRGRTQAMLGSTLLLATPFFIEQGASQYADVPLGFFVLATIALLCLHQEAAAHNSGWLALAGLAAAFAAWTKNEGLLFFCAIGVSQMMVLIRRAGRPSPSQAAPMLLAALPVLLVIAYFKLRIAPAGDLFSGHAATVHKLMDLSRYGAILRWYGKELLRFGHWLLVPGTLLLAAYYFLVGGTVGMKGEAALRTSLLALGLTLAGYAVIYLITPYDLYWHLRFSLNRLFLQLWPSAIFLFFMTVRTPEQALADPGRGKATG